jgi:hypothetical protein
MPTMSGEVIELEIDCVIDEWATNAVTDAIHPSNRSVRMYQTDGLSFQCIGRRIVQHLYVGG